MSPRSTTTPSAGLNDGTFGPDVTLADQVVAALVPSWTRGTEPPAPLALAELEFSPTRDESLIYAIGRINPSGSVAATSLLKTLDWHTGDRHDVRVVRGIVVLRRNDLGLHALPKKRVILVPAAARQACHIRAGDSLLLVAAPGHGILLVYPAAAFGAMLAFYHSTDSRDG